MIKLERKNIRPIVGESSIINVRGIVRNHIRIFGRVYGVWSIFWNVKYEV